MINFYKLTGGLCPYRECGFEIGIYTIKPLSRLLLLEQGFSLLGFSLKTQFNPSNIAYLGMYYYASPALNYQSVTFNFLGVETKISIYI